MHRIVESTDARMFGLDDAEVQERRRYVGHVRREIEVRAEFGLGVTRLITHPLASPEHESRRV